MQKTVTCTRSSLTPKKWLNDILEDRVGMFEFSATDASSIPGQPREHYTVRVKITGELLLNWGLARSSENDLAKVLFYYAMEHVRHKIENNIPGDELPQSDEIILMRENHKEECLPVEISEIHKMFGFSFNVNVRKQEDGRGSQSLQRCLEDFVGYIRSEERMTFWQSGNGKNSKKWILRPEEHAKRLLRTFLRGRFGGSGYIFEEIKSGAGRVDLFIISPNGERAVVELKMCGQGYSMAYAQEGKEQLAHYMENKEANNGFLLIFDSRVRDFAQGFQANESVNGMSIVNLVVDVRPYVKQKDAL